MTTEELQSQDTLKQSAIIEPSLKDPMEIVDNVPRLLSLYAFTKALSKSRRGLSLHRQSKAAVSIATTTQLGISEAAANGGQHISRQVSNYSGLTPVGVQSTQDRPIPAVQRPGAKGGLLGAAHTQLDDPAPPKPSSLDAVDRPPKNFSVADISHGPSLTSTSHGKHASQNSVEGGASGPPGVIDSELISTDALSEAADPSLLVQHETQHVTAGEQLSNSNPLSQKSPAVPEVPLQSIPNEASEASSREVVPMMQMKSAAPILTQAYTSPARTISILSRARGVPIFGKMSNNLYEARRLRPNEDSIRQWTTSWKPTITRRLRDMHLGPHTITNLRFCMMGSSPDERSMKPTILIVCTESKRREVELGLANFIKVSIPTGVDFKVVSSIIKPASGVSDVLDEDKSNLGARMRFTAPEDLVTLVGAQMRIQGRDRRGLYPICTIGGIINVGDTLYALSVAHSMFGVASQVEDHYSTLDWMAFGKVKSYEWSGNDTAPGSPPEDDSLLLEHPDEQKPMDWMLTRLGTDFMLPNLFNDPDDARQRTVSGFWNSVELGDGDVWVCGGITGTQYGILDTTPTSILYGQVSYEVLCVALQYPLGMPRLQHAVLLLLLANTNYSRWRFRGMGHQRWQTLWIYIR